MVSKEKIRQQNKKTSRRYRKLHPDRRSSVCRAYREKHAVEVRAYNQIWYRDNRDHALSLSRQWRIVNVERRRENDRKYCRANSDVIRHQNHKRRSKLRNNAVNSVACRSKIKELLCSDKCYWCTTNNIMIEIDHVIPLARGGPHVPKNLVASCIPCNRSKCSQLYWEWDGELAS